MQILLSLLIVAATAGEPQPRRHPDAEQVFHCVWDGASDKDFDHWPEGWVRQRGPKLPGFVPIRLASEATARSGQCLRIELNGGGATIYSPPIEVSSRFSYVLEGRLKTTGLKHDRALLSITFFDAQRQPLGTVYSDKIHDAVDWVTLRLGPLDPDPKQAETAVIGLHVQPGEREDLRATVMFDDIWLGRLPRMKLSSNSPSNVYTDPKDVTINCALSGIVGRDPEIRFQLLDATSGKLQRDGTRGAETVIAEQSDKASALLKVSPSQAGYEGVATWKPPLDEFGFYRVRVAMLSATGVMHERQLTLAIIRPLERPRKGEFGWSLPEGDRPLSLESLTTLLPQVGINWLKFPVWYSEKEENRGDRLMRFAERLESEGIEMVGLLHSPPDNVREHFGDTESMTAANIFSADPSLWLSTLDPVMTRLSLKIRWWQLGRDHDTSFVGYPDLPKKISDIRKQLYRFGQEVHMGFGWRWTAELPKSAGAPWDFLTLSADPPLTGAELETYLDGTQPPAPAVAVKPIAGGRQAAGAPLATESAKAHRVQRWALVEPLSGSEYDVETRARDLVDQMMSAKIHNADTIMMPNPIGDRGVMNDDGTPAELLLPWRTTAMLLGGSRYLGSIRMPQNSSNRIFTRNGDTVMVVWNENPVQEILYLGEDIRQIDMWGRMVKPEQREHEQVINVGPVPTFILGASEPIARWRMAVKFNQERMPSVFGKPHVNGLSMHNFFPQGAGGEVELVTPKEWKVYPQKMTYKLAVNETLVKPFEITLPFDANSGRQPIRLDFDVHVDRHYRFSVYRDLEIGLGDVLVELSTTLDERGTLIVEQRMTNNSDQVVDFRCLLYAPQRRRQSNQVFRLGRGQDLKIYRFPDGRELVGQQLWLRAEEIEGQRILNYRAVVQE